MVFPGIADVILSSTMPVFVGTLFLDGNALWAIAIYYIYHWSIMFMHLAVDSNLTGMLTTDIDALWAFNYAAFLAIGFAVLGAVVKPLLKIPQLTILRSIFWTRRERDNQKYAYPRMGYHYVMLLYLIIMLTASHLPYDYLIPSNASPELAVIIMPFTITALYLIGWLIVRYAGGADRAVIYGTKGKGRTSYNVTTMNRVWATLYALHVVPSLIIGIVTWQLHDFWASFWTALALAAAILVGSIIAYFVRLRNLIRYTPKSHKYAALVRQATANSNNGPDEDDNGANTNLNTPLNSGRPKASRNQGPIY